MHDALASNGFRTFAALCLTAVISGPAVAATPAAGWRTDYEQAIADAKTQNKPVIATVTAVWCGACRQMQQLTLKDPQVARVIEERFVAVSIDGDQRADLVSSLGISAFPTTFVIDAQGKVIHRWVGFQNAGSFNRELQGFAGPSNSVATEFPAVSALYPSNASPFAFSGFCLVSLLDENQLRRGGETFVAEYRGSRVCFHSAAHRDKFIAQPDRYWPVANGNCLVTSREQHASTPGDPRVGVLWKNRLWFFADRERQRRFMRSPHQFAQDRL